MKIFAKARTNGGPLAWWRRPRVQRLGAWLTLLGFLPLAVGGCSYYRTREQNNDAAALSQLAAGKWFIVHQGPSTWQLSNPRLSGETLTGQRAAAPADLAAAGLLNPERRGSPRRYRPAAPSSAVLLNVVHLYVKSDAPALPAESGAPVNIPLASVDRLEVVEKDTGATVASYALGTVGVTAGALALLLVIIALTKSSCPFVYADNGRGYQFVGEAYGGAIFRPSERPDFMPLPDLVPTSAGEYRVKIGNELKERQYTNVAELLLVQHPAGTRALLDRAGRPHTLRDAQPPQVAATGRGTDCTVALRAPDRRVVFFNDEHAGPAGAPNSVVLTFARPAGARQAKLLLRAQNTLWLDYLYGRFIEQFGLYYNTWAAQQHDAPPAEGARWTRAQHIPLRVYVEVAGRWQLVDDLPTVGPLAARDLVVPLGDLGSTAPAGAPVRVKLETGFMFWEVDYAALDASPDLPVQLTRCAPARARTEGGADARAALAAADDQYLKQLRPGTEVSLSFRPELPTLPAGSQRTAFLHTQGYYEHIREFRGAPDVLALRAFERPGRFVEFSEEVYRQNAQREADLAATAGDGPARY